jgi:protein-S-isoprenylcysteine O-methyltransferase Ste14
MNEVPPALIRSSAIGTAVLLALLFIPAGTLRYWQGWVFAAVFLLVSATYTIHLARHDPALLRRRSQAGISHEKELAQKVIVSVFYAAFIALIVLPPLDFRFRWSSMPWYFSAFGDALVATSFYLFFLVSKVNTYAAANVRVEKGQKVISTGMYALVRHPMYSAALVLVIGTPLALGSWWTLLVVPVAVCILYFRLVNEEKVLLRDLAGYSEYMHRVRYRLIPGIF